jgi:hypothetical protein
MKVIKEIFSAIIFTPKKFYRQSHAIAGSIIPAAFTVTTFFPQ